MKTPTNSLAKPDFFGEENVSLGETGIQECLEELVLIEMSKMQGWKIFRIRSSDPCWTFLKTSLPLSLRKAPKSGLYIFGVFFKRAFIVCLAVW